MAINYRFGDVDAQRRHEPGSASLEPGHQAGVRDELAAGDFWGGAGSVSGREFIIQPGRNFQMMCEHVNTHGQKLQTAHSYVTSTDSADRL
jgi:hypothetical protein